MGIFSDAQGQLTPQSKVKPSRNSNSSIQLKMKLLEWPQHFPHFNSMGAMETRVLPWKPEF